MAHVLHVIMAVVGLLSIIFLAQVYFSITYKDFKKIVLLFFVGSIFFYLRAMGGTVVSLNKESPEIFTFAQNATFDLFWTLSGIAAFSMLSLTAWSLHRWLKKFAFKGTS